MKELIDNLSKTLCLACIELGYSKGGYADITRIKCNQERERYTGLRIFVYYSYGKQEVCIHSYLIDLESKGAPAQLQAAIDKIKEL